MKNQSELTTLRMERQCLQRNADVLREAKLPMNNEEGRERRQAIGEILACACRKGRRAMSSNLILAAWLVSTYEDDAAAALLDAADKEVKKWILKEKAK